MKTLIIPIAMFILLFSAVSCASGSKADTWSNQQEQKWKTECKKLLMSNGEREATAEDYCDCMYDKTSEKYTPEEAAKLTENQEREIWDECDYSW